ncbi:intraflagellar transport protein 88 homolog [Ailuropoda melanoleuca]|uniref:intraflagellar transport protein 88 homolog n=1 Tax=Ailuropoda melanoleuca TaxID=9646 RepID=UPI001494FAD9|nr:intraflagellar transport protein 88 homolog [Ailuropoda melanoleuca]
MGRPMTGAIQDGITRPMTAVRAPGFTKAALRGSAFDPLGQSRGPAPPLEAKNEDRYVSSHVVVLVLLYIFNIYFPNT